MQSNCKSGRKLSAPHVIVGSAIAFERLRCALTRAINSSPSKGYLFEIHNQPLKSKTLRNCNGAS